MAKLLVFLVLVVVAGVAPVAEADGKRGRNFEAKLTGDQEVPPVITDTTGRVRIRINKAETEGEFTLTVNEGVRVTQSHLHCARAGVNGPVIIFLAGLHAAGLDIDGKWVSNATFTDQSIVNVACGATVAAVVAQMRLGNVYANVHTVAHPGGEVRGQIMERKHDDD